MTSTDRHPRGLLKRLAAVLRRPASVFDANNPPVHPQSVRLEIHLEQEDGEPDLLMPQIVIDGRTLAAFDHGPIDLSELERSLAGDGTYFIWTCTCGDAGCGGRTNGVRVEHSDGVVRWHDRDARHHYGFTLADITTALDAVRSAGRQIMLQRPALHIAPDRNRPYLGLKPVDGSSGRNTDDSEIEWNNAASPRRHA